MSKQSDLVDPTRVYCTNAEIIKIGRAVAVSLDDAKLPGNARQKHMTIFFRKRPKWTDVEVAQLRQETLQWIAERNGDSKAPVTFTIDLKNRRRSVNINGDLAELCLYLRVQFASMSSDSQREPHVELFVGGGGKSVNGKNSKSDEDKKRVRCQRILERIDVMKAKKLSEIDLLDQQSQALQVLAANAEALDQNEFRDQLRQIAHTFKDAKKEFKPLKGKRLFRRKGKERGQGRGRRGGGGRGRERGRGRRGGRGQGRGPKGAEKNWLSKEEKKELREQKKELREQKKAEREQRKKVKIEKREKLQKARLEALPLTKEAIGNKKELVLFLDGYNIIGCDPICQLSMRQRRGKKEARRRITDLLQKNFVDDIGKRLKFEFAVAVNLWFDGRGRSQKVGDILVDFSKDETVDDKLVNYLSKNGMSDNANVLVVTADRGLTLRLIDIGVKVMKSSQFYEKYVDNDRESKDDNSMDVDVDSDENAKEMEEVITAKVDRPNDDTDGSDAEEEDDDDDDDEKAPDVYQDEDDEEFTIIFGEESDYCSEGDDGNKMNDDQ